MESLVFKVNLPNYGYIYLKKSTEISVFRVDNSMNTC